MNILAFDPAPINLGYCLMNNNKKVLRWGKFSIESDNEEDRCRNLINKLNELDLTNESVEVVYENQPGFNKITPSICSHLITYFTMKGIPIRQFVGKKLKYYVAREGDEPIPNRVLVLNKGHYKNKQLSIEHCRRLLIHNNEEQRWKDMLVGGGKSFDDESDAYIMACASITK